MSPFIERLGWVLIHSLWQLALLAAAAFVVQSAMQRTSAAARYAALLALLGLVVAAPLITWSVLPTPAVLPVAELPAPSPALAPVPTPKLEPPAPVLTPAPVNVEATAPITPVAPAPLEPILPVKVPEPLQPTWSQWAQQLITPWLSTIVWGWSLGVLAFAIRPLWSWFTVRQLRTQGVSPVSESVQAALAETARRLGVTQAVRVLQSTIVQVPVVAGYLKPVILLPASIVTGLPASQLEAILAHELAHIRRHDYLANLIQTLVETVFFYHPAVWWLSHQIRSERENCCDDIAVAMLGNRLDYSRALLAVEELRGSPTTLAVGASGGSLLGRVRRLFHRDVEQLRLSNGSITLCGLIGVGLIALAAVASTNHDRSAELFVPGTKAEIDGFGTIEVLGLRFVDSEWWSPDGSNLSASVDLGDPMRHLFNDDPMNGRQIGIVTRFSGADSPRASRVHLHTSRAVGHHGSWSSMGRRRAEQNQITDIRFCSTNLSPNAVSGELTVLLSFDAWSPWYTIDLKSPEASQNEGPLAPLVGRTPSSLASTKCEIGLQFKSGVHEEIHFEQIALDAAGNEIPARGSVGNNHLGLRYYAVPESQVAKLRYRLQRYTHEVRFRDISLKAGHQTEPQARVQVLHRPVRPAAFSEPVTSLASWPQLGGSAAHNPISPVTNLPSQFHLDRQENIRWSQPIGDFAFSSPVVSGGKVLIGTNNAIGRDPRFPASIDRACLQCFDERTGEFLWQYSSPKMEQGRRHDWPSVGICSTPVIEGDRVWFATNRCEIVCLDLNGHRDNEDDGEPEASAPGDSDATAKTLTPNPSPGGRGEPEMQRADVVWKYDMFNTLGIRPLNATCVTPVIAGDLLLLNSGNDVDESYMNVPAPEAPAFLAFHKTTGQLIWSDKTPNPNILGNGCSMGAPAVAKIDGVWQAIFAGYDGWLYAFDLECIQRGENLLLWTFDLNPKESQYRLNGPRNEFTYRGLPTTPVVVGNHVFAAVGHNPERGEGLGRLWCIDATKRGDLSSDLVYNKSAPEVVIPHKRVQACEPDKGDFTRPNPNSGVEWVYTTDDLNKNGKIEYEEQMHLSNSLPAIHDGLILTTDLSGLVHCLDVTTGELLWTHDQLATCWSGPLLADGKAWVIDEDGDLSIFALSREKQLIAEIAMNSSGYTNFAAANQTLYVATKTQLVAIGSGAFFDPAGERAAWMEIQRLKTNINGGASNWLHNTQRYESFIGGINPGLDPSQLAQMRKDLAIDQLPHDADLWTVPKEAWPHIGRLGSLTELSIVASDMRGQTQHLSHLKNLRSLRIVNSQFLPSDLAELKSLTNLEELDVMLSVFEEPQVTLQAQMGELSEQEKATFRELISDPKRQHLLSAAVLTDRAFDQLGNLTKLRTLRLINTVASELTLTQLKRYPQLERLEVSFIAYQPESLLVLGQLKELRELSGVPYASQEILPVASSLQHIEKLERGAGDLTDAGVTELLKLKSLKSLVLWNAQISNTGLMRLGELPQLEILDIRFVPGITDEGVQRFRQAHPTCRVIRTDQDLNQNPAKEKPVAVKARLPGGLEIELVGVTPNSAATTEGWRPDGSPIVGAGDWPRGAMFSRNGDRFTVTTDSASKMTPDPLARDLLFESRGLRSHPAWVILNQKGLMQFESVNADETIRRRLSYLPKESGQPLTVEMALTDSPWGPWQQIDKSGKRINTITTFEPDQKLYEEIKFLRFGPALEGNTQRPLELVLEEPATHDDYQSGVFDITVRFIGTDQKVWTTYAQPKPRQNGRRQVVWRTGGDVPLEKIDHFEFRLRPYRHFITFKNVPLNRTPGAQVTVEHRSLPLPPTQASDPRFTAQVPGGVEIELLRIVRNDLPEDQSWTPDGKPSPGRLDWPQRSHYTVQPDGNGYSSSNEGPGSDRAWDFAYEVRSAGSKPFASVDLVGDGSVSSSQFSPAIGPRLVTVIPKDPESLKTFQIRVGTEPWGQWIQVGADGKVLNPEAINKKSNSPDPLIWIAGAGIDEDNPDRSWFKWMALPHANQLYSMEVRAIDDDGQSHQSKSSTQRVTAATMHEITQWFDLPVEKLNRFEYRMRPYRHLVTYDNICTDPKKPTEVRVSVEPIVYPNEAAVEKSRLLVLNPDNTPWQGSLVAGHIGYIPPDAKAWNAWVDKDGQADLSALPAGKHWLISRFPWSAIPVETPLQQTVRQPLRLGTPPKKHSSSNYSGNLSVQRDEQGREFIQCDFYNNTDELWSFSELDLTLEAGWFWTESQGHSPQWLGDTLAEVPQIEIPPGQKGSLRIDWSEWAKRGVWDPMSGPQAISKPVLPDQEPGKIWVRISGPGFGTNPVAVMHPDKLLAVSGEPVPQPPAPDEVDGPRVNLVGLTWNRVPKNHAWEPTGNPMPVPDWAKSITQLVSAEMSDVPVLLYEVHGLKGTPSINFHESSITTGDQQLTGSVFRQAQLRLRTRDEYRNVPPKVSISDEPWGPWRTITKSGEMAAPVPEDSPYRTGYASVTAHGIRPLQRNAQVQGLIIHHPTGFRDLYDLEVEEVWLDPTNSPSNIPRGDSIPLGNGPSTRLEIEYPLPSYDSLKEYRYRIRPYRHQFVFENVNYAPSQNPSNYTPFKTVYTKLEHDLPKPEAAIQQPDPQDRPRLHAKGEAEARAELERLAITDPGHIHATRRATANPNGWKWSVYLPPGKTWRLYCESGMIPKWQDIQPTAETTSYPIHRKDEQRIIELEAYVSPDTSDDGELKLWVEADRSFLEGLDWVAWKIAPEVADYITGRTQKSGTINLDLDIGGVNTLNAGRNRFRRVLTHRRFREANDKENVEPEIMPGFCVWIQADPVKEPEPLKKTVFNDPTAQDRLIQHLSHPEQSTRDQAANLLRTVYKPSAKEQWQAKVDSIPKNAPRAEVIAKLGIDEKRDLYGAEDTMEQYRLDDTWMVRIWFTGDLQNLNTIELIEQLHRPWVDPPAGFTGTWVTYYVNGTKAHEIEYLNGKYHGRHRSYHSNGQLLVQQHFVDDVAHGEDTGYDASGNLSYRGLYENGKQVGPWIHYNEDGSERSRTEHPAPNPSKPQPSRLTFEPVEGRVLLPNGQPAAEVPVVLRRMPWGQHLLPQQVEKEPEDPHDLAHTVTDAQGRFAFRNVPIPELYRGRDEVKLDVVAKLDSHAVAWSRVIVGTPVTLTLQPEAKLTGKITGPSGQPVAGAVIQAAWIMSLRHITQADLEEGRWPSWKDRSYVGLTDCQLVPTATTDQNGEFTLSGLPRGLGMRLFVRSEDFEPLWFDAATAAIEGENLRLAKRPVASGPLTIRMQTPRELLTIRVVDDATGAPLEGAKVIAHPSGKLPVSQTGNESVFRLAAGDVSISAELPIEKGYLRGWGLFEAGQAQNAEIRLKRGIPLRGRVIDQETKQPLAGIEVRVDGRLEEIQIGNACLWTKTGNDGSFELLLSQGKHIAWVRPFKSIYRDVGVSMLDGQFGVMAHQSATIDTNQLPDTLELALERAQGIEGVVLDPQGELAAGVQYRGLYKTDYGAQSFGDVTTEQGEFVISEPFEAEPLARSVPLDVLFWDEQRGLVGTLRVDPVVPSVAHEVELQPAGQVTGRVVDDQGRPVAHALVQCGLMFPSFTRQTGAVVARPVRTGEDGRFEIRSGVAGYRLDIEVDRPGYVKAWKTLSLTRTEQDKDLGEIVLEIEKPVQKLTVELPKLQGLTPEAQYTALSGSFDSLVQQVDAARKVARNYDVVPDNTSQLYAQAMWDVAQSARAGDVERKALVWMVGMRRLSGNHGAEYEKLRQQAGARLIEAYADQPDVAAVADSVAWTQYSLPEGAHRAALVFLEKSPDRSARGICCLLAAESLVDWGPARSRPITPETISRVEPLLKRVVSEFADLPHADDWRKGTLGDCAQGWLETLQQVQQGIAVPDMAWKDSRGQPLRISDLKGKVVVLDHGTLGDDAFSRTLLNQAGPDRVIVIQVSAQNVETAWKALEGLAVPRRQISHEEANRFERMWNIRTWPGAIVLNEQGGIAGEDLREKLPEVLSSVLKPKAEPLKLGTGARIDPAQSPPAGTSSNHNPSGNRRGLGRRSAVTG